MVGFMAFLALGKTRSSAVLLGLAIAIKGFPHCVSLPLFAFQKKFVEILLALTVAGLSTLLALSLFEGGALANAHFS